MDRREILRTARLVVTTWVPSDAAALAEVHADPETMRFVRHGRPETLEETRALVAQYRAEDAERGFTKWRVAAPDGRLVGRAGFGVHDGVRELGYTLRREEWGRGLATEVAAGLVAWHRRTAPDEPLSAQVAVGHEPSARVLRKVGFVEVGEGFVGDVCCTTFRLRPAPPTPPPAHTPGRG